MGKGSVAGLPLRGDLNEDWELLLKSYAVSYDALNSNMLTDTPGKFKPTTANQVKAEYYRIKLLCKKYAPHKLAKIERLEKISLANLSGKLSDKQALTQMRNVAHGTNVSPSLFLMAENRINISEGIHNPQHKHTKKKDPYKMPKWKPIKPPSFNKRKYNPMNLLDSMFNMPNKRGRK